MRIGRLSERQALLMGQVSEVTLTSRAFSMKWPTNKNNHAYMRERQRQNRITCLNSKAESWMLDKLKGTGLKWTRQATWGYRLFDFWNHLIGVAIEVDGPEHMSFYDKVRDEYNYRTSGIAVLRVRNFNNQDALCALEKISKSESWNERRAALGLNPIGRK